MAALDQPVRRDLYRVLSDTEGWTGRDDAAAALGVPRSVAAFHLDKLAAAGVVEVEYERLGGRTGPGAGRPSKLYRPVRGEAGRADEAESGVGDVEVRNVLAPYGYEPVAGRGDEIALGNCPFHRLAEEQREFVCGMNLDFIDGVLDGLGVGDRYAARLDPSPGHCCVRIAPG